MNCFDRLIFTTNNDNCIKVNQDSRRFVVFEVSSALKGNTEYFNEFTRHIENPHTRYEFYQYLMSRDISSVDWINDRPMTACYSSMVESQLCREYTFIREVIILPRLFSGSARIIDFTAKELFDNFCEWLTNSSNARSSEYKTDITKFGGKLSALTKEGANMMKGVARVRKTTHMEYSFDLDVFPQEMVRKMWLDVLPVAPM